MKSNEDKGKGAAEVEGSSNALKYPLAKFTKQVTQLDYGAVETYYRFEVPRMENAIERSSSMHLEMWKVG